MADARKDGAMTESRASYDNHQPPSISLPLIGELQNRMDAAFFKYGELGDNYRTLGALRLEYREVEEAIQDRDAEAVRAELLDLANVALRRVIELDNQEESE